MEEDEYVTHRDDETGDEKALILINVQKKNLF